MEYERKEKGLKKSEAPKGQAKTHELDRVESLKNFSEQNLKVQHTPSVASAQVGETQPISKQSINHVRLDKILERILKLQTLTDNVHRELKETQAFLWGDR